MPDRLLRPGEVAGRLGTTVEALRVHRRAGSGPPFVRVGNGHPKYRESDLERYLAELPASADPARVLADLDGWLAERIERANRHIARRGDGELAPDERAQLKARADALREVRDRLASTGTTTPERGSNDE